MILRKLVALITALALCVALPAFAQEEKSVTLVESWGFSAFYPVMSPESATSDYGITYWSHNFYDTLVKYDENGELVPSLAKAWEISPDGLTYTFTLRENVKFSDGTPLTAEQVKTSLLAAAKNLGSYNGSYGKLTTLIGSMEAIDDLTLQMQLTQPYYGALNDLSMGNPLSIVGAAALNEDLTPSDAVKTQTVGTGPYMFAGESDGTTFSFVRNPYYWGEAPEADRFSVKVIADNDAKVLALRSGEVDAVVGSTRLGFDAYVELSQTPGYGVATDTNVALTRYLGFNLSAAPFDDVRVRQAVSYALDRDLLCEAVFRGIEQSAYALFSPDKPYCDVDVTAYAYDVEKAKALMEEAGWVDTDGDGVREKDGVRLEMPLSYMQESGSVGDALMAIAAQLQEIGFRITPSATDMMTWYGLLMSGDYQITFYSTYGGAFDPFALITNINPEVSADPIMAQVATVLEGGNALILELDATASQARVQEIYHEVLGAIADQVVVAPISYTHEFAAWNDRVVAAYAFCRDSHYVEVANFDLQ